MRCIKPVLRLLRSRLSIRNTHAVVVSPIPFPYVTPILNQGYQHGCWPLFLRLLILPAPALRRRSCSTVRLRNGRLWNASTEQAAVRIGALASPREIVTSNEANLRARGGARGIKREGGREREGEKNSGVRLCVAGTDKRRVLSLACLLLIIWYMCYQLVFIIEDTIERTVRFERLRRWFGECGFFG